MRSDNCRIVKETNPEGQFILSFIIQVEALAGLFSYDRGEMNSPLFLCPSSTAELGNQEAKRMIRPMAIIYLVSTRRINRSLLAVGFIISLSLTLGCNKTAEQKGSESEDSRYETTISPEELADASLEAAYRNMPEESFEEVYERLNPWRKDYYKNDWDEDMTENPYIYSEISGNTWDIHIEYTLAFTQFPDGAFRIYLLDEGRGTTMYGPVKLLVRGADGETINIEVDNVDDSVAYIVNPSSVELLKSYLNTEGFDILLEFDKWNERHQTKGQWWASEPGYLQYSIDTML